MAIESINPATGESIASYDELTVSELQSVLERAERAACVWRRTPIGERALPMRRAAALLRSRRDIFARLMALEMGKPIQQGRSEVDKCALVCDYYADNAAAFLSPTPVATDATTSCVAFQPLGVVLAVMPWNFPFWQVFRFAAPALMAGNAGLLKHASNVPGCALAIEELLHEAGFSADVFRTLLIRSPAVATMIDDPRVSAVTLTGSTAAGKAIGARAGGALKKTVLELGGSDPYIVLEDADLAAAAAACASGRMINGGQSCIAAKRFIVVEAVREQFEALFVAAMRGFDMGNPLDEHTTLGPLARIELRDELHDQVRRSVAAGARVLLGGAVPARPGAFYPPTVLTGVRKGMAVYDEETFGPVAAIIGVDDEAEAIRVANDTVYGLGAAVFTRDIARGERIAREELEAGSCFVNAQVRSDPRLPFGGVKESGYGRELGEWGIREFVNIKTVYIQ